MVWSLRCLGWLLFLVAPSCQRLGLLAAQTQCLCVLPPFLLQIESEQLCQTGLDEEPELHWRQDQAAALLPCQNIKHTFARIARECTDVHFFTINVGTIPSNRRATAYAYRHTIATGLDGWPSCSRHHHWQPQVSCIPVACANLHH